MFKWLKRSPKCTDADVIEAIDRMQGLNDSDRKAVFVEFVSKYGAYGRNKLARHPLWHRIASSTMEQLNER